MNLEVDTTVGAVVGVKTIIFLYELATGTLALMKGWRNRVKMDKVKKRSY